MRVCVLTVRTRVVLGAAGGQFVHLPTAEPRPFLPELRVELGQEHQVVFDLWKEKRVWMGMIRPVVVSIVSYHQTLTTHCVTVEVVPSL